LSDTSRTTIVVAIIGLAGTIGAAAVSNWDKLKGNQPSAISTPQVVPGEKAVIGAGNDENRESQHPSAIKKISGEKAGGPAKIQSSTLPYNIGDEGNGILWPIIEEGCVLPCTGTNTYLNFPDYVTSMDFDFYKGKPLQPINEKLFFATFRVSGITPLPARAQEIKLQLVTDGVSTKMTASESSSGRILDVRQIR